MGDRVYLSKEEAAEYLGTTPRHIRRLVERHQIPTSRVGRKLRFDRRRLDEWMTANTTEAAS